MKKIRGFLRQHWFSALSAIFSLIAILLSVQANYYSRKGLSADIDIKDIKTVNGIPKDETWFLNVTGCYQQASSQYYLEFRIPGEFWISNNGGSNVTLLTLDFSTGVKVDYWDVGMYEHPNLWHQGEYIAELDVPAGSSKPIYVYAVSSSRFQTLEDALDSVNYADFMASETHQRPQKATWSFRFSNNDVFTYSYQTAEFPQIDLRQQLEQPCKQ